jgi:hypothetical protein
MLIHEPLLISKPFRDFGYFEKLSTIEQSKNDLKKNGKLLILSVL